MPVYERKTGRLLTDVLSDKITNLKKKVNRLESDLKMTAENASYWQEKYQNLKKHVNNNYNDKITYGNKISNILACEEFKFIKNANYIITFVKKINEDEFIEVNYDEKLSLIIINFIKNEKISFLRSYQLLSEEVFQNFKKFIKNEEEIKEELKMREDLLQEEIKRYGNQEEIRRNFLAKLNRAAADYLLKNLTEKPNIIVFSKKYYDEHGIDKYIEKIDHENPLIKGTLIGRYIVIVDYNIKRDYAFYYEPTTLLEKKSGKCNHEAFISFYVNSSKIENSYSCEPMCKHCGLLSSQI